MEKFQVKGREKAVNHPLRKATTYMCVCVFLMYLFIYQETSIKKCY